MGAVNWIEVGRMDELARQDTAVHRLDARAKVVVTFAFIAVVMSFPRYAVAPLTPFLLYPVVLMGVGRIPVWEMAKKILIAAPFALVIGIFNPFIDRQSVLAIGPIAVTGGWVSFVSIMLRFLLTVSAALVLMACTGMYRMGAGLERLGVPRVFVVQLLFLYRYLFVVSNEAIKMVRSFKLRSNGRRTLPFRVYASLAGHLLVRSMDRADRVHRAMVARGFDGEIHVLRQTVFRWSDAAFVFGCVGLFLTARVWNVVEVLGRLLTGIVS